MRSYHNIEASPLHRREYTGWDAQGNKYSIKRQPGSKSWWVYKQQSAGLSVFYAGSLRLVSLRLEKSDATVALPLAGVGAP